MTRVITRELLATFGADRLAPLSAIYISSLGLASLIGASDLTGTATFGMMLWTSGGVVVALVACFSLFRFRRNANELRLPGCRRVLLRSCVGLGLALALPGVLLWIMSPAERHSTLWPILGASLALLPPTLLSFVHLGGRPPTAGKSVWPWRSAHSPSQVIRVFLGGAFSPVSVNSRAFRYRALGASLWSVPLALILSSAEPWRDLAPFYLTLTAVVIWAWLMTSLVRFIRDRSGAFAELALLPGMGDGSSQRRALYRAVLARPLFIVLCFLAVRILTAWSAWHSPQRVAHLGLGCAVLLMFCAATVLQQLQIRRVSGTKAAVLMQLLAPLLLAQTLLVTLPAQAWISQPRGERLFFFSILALAAVPISIIWIHAHRLAKRPHPFLEIST